MPLRVGHTSRRSTTDKYSRMAHLPRLPDPSDWKDSHDQSGTFQAGDSPFSFTELTKILGQHGAGTTSEDLALDLLLHETVTQACMATRAAGAAIALSQNGEFVCRATTGNHAPDLGSHLSTHSGLSGACVQSRQVQRCDDTETDARVDAVACRRLGARSVVVVPLLREGEVAGILEAFSPRPGAFTESDAQVLLAHARRVMGTLAGANPKQETDSPAASVDHDTVPVPRNDPWMPVLTALIVTLALLLGWMLGYKGWGKMAGGDKTPPRTAVSTGPAAPAANETSVPTVPAPLPVKAGPEPVVTNSKAAGTSPGELVVYEKGKVVFQEKPAPARVPSRPAQVPFSAANSLLIERVEPQYPEQARQAHVQGVVVLAVEVNEKGAVQELRPLNGDPQLAAAAAAAVRQWRFRPYAPGGQPLSFQTQVTVDFKLP